MVNHTRHASVAISDHDKMSYMGHSLEQNASSGHTIKMRMMVTVMLMMTMIRMVMIVLMLVVMVVVMSMMKLMTQVFVCVFCISTVALPRSHRLSERVHCRSTDAM